MKDPALIKIYSLSPSELHDYVIPSLKNPQEFYLDLHRSPPNQTFKQLLHDNIDVLTYFDLEYPRLLKQIYDPPWVLYMKGNSKLLQLERSLAVVGTRHPTKLGTKSISSLLPPLINQKFIIISGLARGIDRLAHIEAIKHGGATIAVLGSGLNVPYPKENLQLFNYMCHHQLVISEYPPATPPTKWQFPNRNRIISGLAQGLLVVEAAKKSGSLISADQALEQGREVFAVPGPIFSDMSQGTNHLIQQGAKLVREPEDILSELQVHTRHLS
ncbi:DNA-processing protein DprA [Alkalicoccobacillus porphyridii]|nr:DNA-processing protein DprA [Alkalicoccobacillus porphyridii]